MSQLQLCVLHVVCWACENRLDEYGGWGFSIHPDKESADLWERDEAIMEEFIRVGMNNLTTPYVCGRGMITRTSHELLARLGDQPGVFVHKLDGDTTLQLISGKTPCQVSLDFQSEGNSVPD